MPINVFEPKSQFISQKKEIINAVKKVFNSGNYILGKEVSKLEKKFSELHQTKYGHACIFVICSCMYRDFFF